MSRDVPDKSVLDAFGIVGSIRPLDGGRSLCFLAGGVVLKPSDDDGESQRTAQVIEGMLHQTPPSGAYRLPRPLPLLADSHGYVFAGWTAWTLLPGEEGPADRFEDILRASHAFHADLAGQVISKPLFLSQRSNRWREADLVTWDEKRLEDVPGVSGVVLARFDAALEGLRQLRRKLPGGLRQQLIHGDLTGNILFDREGGEPPGIIDMTFYWRPAAYAEAIVVADGLSWHGQGRKLVEAYGTDAVRLQLLVRALYWRCLTFAIDSDHDWVEEHSSKVDYEKAVNILRGIIQ